MTTDLTPEELAGLREHVRDWSDGRVILPDVLNRGQFLRLVAMAERRIPGGDVLLAGDLTRALQERDAMAERTQAVLADLETATQQAFREQERAARYRAALALALATEGDREKADIIRAAFAEPEEAQHGGD